ncbi:CAP domain-containing protein [Rossellomorea aquimaris]|uniref:CAP domain-containing protein n=1 Tax=Rossellomorea aquimaris TaxID=189382 RepID=UPI001CD62D14|nr:CAP domain-containing protein [Rossellomorea aquimaris]MCA1053889.1 CAP domain-containing protein [Rossellomorea aquimaris]
MKRLLLIIVLLLIAYGTKPVWEEKVQATGLETVLSKIEGMKDNEKVKDAFDQFYNGVSLLLMELEMSLKDLDPPKNAQEELNSQKPDLSAPDSEVFSIHNIELGDRRSTVEQELGSPDRTTLNEYGVNWNTYHDHYHNFFMVSYDDEQRVNGLYTNQDLLTSSTGITMDSAKSDVQKTLGVPLENIRKGLTLYQLQTNGEHDVFKVDNSYVTVFYDKHEQDSVTAIQIIEEGLEGNKQGFYSKTGPGLKEGFELQLFDLTNAARVNHGLDPLTWNDKVRETARKHSLDMADHDYFSHTNLNGESPFDRMEDDQVAFRTAGENLAYGQMSSIFAHEGLMNSKGHRENILQNHYEYLGVGVAFNEESQPYFTENFFSK